MQRTPHRIRISGKTCSPWETYRAVLEELQLMGKTHVAEIHK